MKKNLLTFVLILVAAAVGFLIGQQTPVRERVTDDGFHSITVLETTDTHGAYFDATYDGGQNRSSFAKVSSYVKGIRSSGRDVVLVDNGDNIQGDMAAVYYNYVAVNDEHIFSRIADFIGYDAIVVGNHDIEPGHPVFDRLNRASKIPYLAANAVHSSGSNAGKPYFKPYTILNRGGFRIAVIGMTNANIKSWLGEKVWEGMDFLQISSVAQKWVDEVREKENPDIVIVSVHSGTSAEGGPVPDIENEALYLANTLTGVDVVLGGHDHRPYEDVIHREDGTEVAYLNAGTKATVMARCDIGFFVENGQITSKVYDNTLVPLPSVTPDPDYVSYMKKQFAAVSEYANEKIGELTSNISFEDVLDGPSAYMSLIHDVQLNATGADISISAPLSNKGFVKAGTVTRQGLSELYRFENTLYKVEMTGRQIKDYLEYSYDLWITRKGPSYNYDSMGGINYSVNRKAPFGDRIDILSLSSGAEIEPDKVYSVAINSYRLSGGGGHLENGAGVDPSSIRIIETYPEIRDLVGEYVASKGTLTPEVRANWSFVN